MGLDKPQWGAYTSGSLGVQGRGLIFAALDFGVHAAGP